MSVEFRQRTPGEYAQIVWKRKWLIILPAIAITVAVAWVVWRLPNVYESTTLLIVRPSTIPGALVPTLSDVDLSMRISNISQMVASRSSLEPLIMKYDLYREERARGEALEGIVERMRADIEVEVDKSRNDVTNAFRISYRERDPRKTQAVTAELAGKYVTAQTTATTQAGESTAQFFEQQLAQAKAELDEVDKRRLQYMSENVNNLPSQAGALIGQYTGLREQQKALIADIGRLRDQISTLNTSLGDLGQQADQENEELSRQLGDVKTSPAYGQLISRKAALEAEYQNMLTTLKEKNPDVRAKKAEIDSVVREMKQMETNAAAQVEEIQRRRAGYVNPRLKSVEYNIQLAKGELDRQQRMLDQTTAQIAEMEKRINSVPTAEVALEALNRDYATKKSYYDELLKKQQAANLTQQVASQQQGETLQVVDSANLPTSPVAPKRTLLMGLGLVLGLGVGASFAALFEVPRLLTIQTTGDAEHYTGLPVLVSLPELRTPEEARWVPRRRMLLLAAGVAVTILSIPALALFLKMMHILDRFAS
ncbi:MAG TPA: GNVR domain-containing protein [Pyrinomonadaceae bacterium]|jgi:polysaccharide chain length determinant protein (PEP-CTERM system associated)